MFEHNDIFRDPEYRYHRILVLDEDFPPALRRLIGKVTGIILIIYTLVFILPYAYQRFFPQLLTSPVFQTAVKAVPLLEKIAPPPLLEVLRVPAYVPYLAGREVPLDPRLPRGNAFLLLVLISFVFIKLLGAYRNSFYCDVESMLERGETGSKTPYTSQNYEVCDIFFRTRYGDLTAAFVESAYGQKILERLGISLEDVEVYLKSRTAIVDFRTKTNDVCRMYTLRDLATLLITLDPDFYQFLFQIGLR
jgi:hypothetical protein